MTREKKGTKRKDENRSQVEMSGEVENSSQQPIGEGVGGRSVEDVLRAVANDPKATDAARVSAARALHSIEMANQTQTQRVSTMTRHDLDRERDRIRADIARLSAQADT